MITKTIPHPMRSETNEKGGDDELGGHAGELGGSDDTDSIIDLKKVTNSSDGDEEGWNESRSRKFSL